AKVGFKVSFSSYLDETAAGADLILPDLHPLEQWNDARPRAGVFALLQPVMQPVFPEARHTGDVLLRAAGRDQTFQDYLQGTWHAWVEVHPATAARWGVANGDFLLLKSSYGAVKAPVWITPGVRPDVLAAATGQGHTAYGRYAKDRSGNAFELLSSTANAYGG